MQKMGTLYKCITYGSEEGVGRLSLNRPSKRNALDEMMLHELSACLKEAGKDEGLRLLVLDGAGNVFCSGADLSWFLESAGAGEEVLLHQAELFYDCFHLLYSLPVPSVAVVHGAVFGGGMGMLAACDIGLARQGTRFSFSEVRLGLVPATISPFVLNRTGGRSLGEHMLSGGVFDAAKAFGMGLINHYGDEDSVVEWLADFTKKIKLGGPQAVRKTKELIRSAEVPFIGPHTRSETCRMLAAARASDEAMEGLKAFGEKRPPSWQ